MALALACSSSQTRTGDGGTDALFDAGPFIDVGPPGDAGPPGPASVLQEHLHLSRDGLYTDPLVTKAAAATLHVDPKFSGVFDAMTYAELLYVDGFRAGVDALFVVTSSNHVTAIDAATGQLIWDKVLGPVVQATTLGCQEPPVPLYGIMSTPIIDPTTRTLYVESFQPPASGTPPATTLVYAMSIDDGSIRKGWPVDLGTTVKGFDSTLQHTRAGLALLGGTVYVPFSSIYDSCLDKVYHGWVVGIKTTDPTEVSAWSTTAKRGGIWGGVASDGTSLFFTTGNTDVGTKTWGGGEAMIRLPQSLVFSGKTTDYFTPSNWQSLDKNDLDLGSASPVTFDVPGATPSALAAAIGKEGVLHLLDRENLGGIGKGNGSTGEGVYSVKLVDGDGAHGRIATYETVMGRYVVVRGYGSAIGCPKGTSGDLVAVRVTNSSPPKLQVAWCATSHGDGSPVVTTTDGKNNAIVWAPSAAKTNRLYGWDGDTGAVVYGGGDASDAMGMMWRWASPVVAKGQFYAASKGKVYRFAPP
jgi:PQQ enzyme-like repeat protein